MTARTILRLRFPPVSPEAYQELFAVLTEVSSRVQALPPDGALMDVTGALARSRGGPAVLAEVLRSRLRARCGVRVAIGGGPSRMLATMAADACPPGADVILPGDPETCLAFLHGRPVEELPGVGAELAETFRRYGITTVGDLAALPSATVRRIAGPATGRLLAERARGVDRRRVTPGGAPARIAAARRFASDVLDPEVVRPALLALATDLGARLRAAARTCGAVELEIGYADRSTTTRTRALPEPTAGVPALADALYGLYASLGLERARIRSVTARVLRLGPARPGGVQLTLDDVVDEPRRPDGTAAAGPRRPGPGRLPPGAHGG